jgi:hypothetical protein
MDDNDIVKLLTPLPSTSAPPPDTPSNFVSIFQDPDWNSQRIDIDLGSTRPSQRQFLQAPLQDTANWVAYNLPVGTVMTLMDDIDLDTDGKNIADLSNCGRSVDLVGTGSTQAVDLAGVNMADCVSTYFWRKVDLSLGAIELFDNDSADDKFSGNRATVFLSEFPSGTIISIQDWYLNDRISSIRWKSMQDRQTATLFENPDGTGTQYNNIVGYGVSKEVADLGAFGFDDSFSAFRWDAVIPKKEIIAPFAIPSTSFTGTQGLTSSLLMTNNSSLEQPLTVSINKENAQEVTTTAMDQHVVGVTATYTSSVTAGVEGVASSKTEWSVGLKYEYTHSDTNSQSQTQTIAVNIAQTINAAPHTQTQATLLISIGQIPDTQYTTTADRWYDMPVVGGLVDPANNGWWKRTEPVTVSINGSLAVNTIIDIEATDLTKPKKPVEDARQLSREDARTRAIR